MNVKFHKNCENAGKILKISYVRCDFVKWTFIFSCSDEKFFCFVFFLFFCFFVFLFFFFKEMDIHFLVLR